MIEKYYAKPKTLFIIDAIGAIISAFFLGVVLVQFEKYFGIPTSTLYILASIPLFFALYDFYSYRMERKEQGVLLKGVAIMNILYCCLSIGFALYHMEQLTFLGWSYILVEVLIVLIIASIELNVAKKLQLE